MSFRQTAARSTSRKPKRLRWVIVAIYRQSQIAAAQPIMAAPDGTGTTITTPGASPSHPDPLGDLRLQAARRFRRGSPRFVLGADAKPSGSGSGSPRF